MPLINFSGLASGIDSEALIKATSDALRAQRVLPQQKRVQDITDTNSSLTELKTKLTTLQTKARAFATINGGPLSKAATSSDETILTASASNSASNGTYSVRVTQLATSATFSFDSRFTDPAAAVAPGIVYTGVPDDHSDDIAITIGTADPFYVQVTATTTLNDIASAINSATTTATASIVNTGQTPPYALVIKSNATGATDGNIAVTVGGDITTTGIFTTSTEEPAQDSQFTISGISGTISKSTNSISDVIPGVTFNLIAEAPTTDVTINVNDDKTGTTTRVQEFVTAFNDIVTYMKEKNLIERVEEGQRITNIFGPLSTTRIDENALLSIRNAMTSSSYANGNYVKIFADLGITTERDGTLKFDSTKFQDNLSLEASSVNQILTTFGDTVATTGGTIDQQIRFNGIIDIALTNNKDQISSINDRIGQAEASIARNEEIMRARFARLESLTSQLQNQQAALTSALAGLG